MDKEDYNKIIEMIKKLNKIIEKGLEDTISNKKTIYHASSAIKSLTYLLKEYNSLV